MNDTTVNLLRQESGESPAVPAAPQKVKHPHRGIWLTLRIVIYVVVSMLIIAVTLSYRVIQSSNGVVNTANRSIFGQIGQLFNVDEKLLDGEVNDRVNVLLVGNGGEGHTGSYLADTIILASIKPSTGEVGLLSIPRDLFVPIPGYDWRKINNALAFGYLRGDDNGEELLSEVVANITGQPVHYYMRVDFEAFRRVIDTVGGVDVTVENPFTDYEFPDYNFGYQVVSFKAGEQHMDGETALQFARSRHGTNGEGSDFARARRQQIVLSALYNKVFSIGTYLNPSKLIEFLDILGDHAKTNMEIWQIVKLGHILRSLNPDDVANHVLDTGAKGPLYSTTTVDGAYILRPKAGLDDFSDIQAIAENSFATTASEELAGIEILNGSTTTGLAQVVGNVVASAGYTVTSFGNAGRTDYDRTVVYDMTQGQKPQTLAELVRLFQARSASTLPLTISEHAGITNEPTLQIAPGLPVDDAAVSAGGADFIVVLGSDASLSAISSRLTVSP